MASYNTNEFRGGLKIILDGEPFTIVENEFVKPGKGQAFNRVRVRNLKTGLSLIHISEPTRLLRRSRMPSSA